MSWIEFLYRLAWSSYKLDYGPTRENLKDFEIWWTLDSFARLKIWPFCYGNGKGFKKNPTNKISSKIYEVFDLNEAYWWKMTVELKQFQEIQKQI
jgi:hypothetical protein